MRKDNSFACHCCGQGTLTEDTFALYNRICKALNFAPLVSSAYRCSAHNAAVGGDPCSLHLLGKAIDLIVHDDMTVDEFADICLDCGAGGVGRYYDDYFVHVDTGEVRNW